MKKIVSKSIEETINAGAELAKSLKPRDVVALRGDLGAGKTVFVKGLAKGLGFDGDVTSPTFVIMHEYRGKTTVYHFDMYRINDINSLYSTGYFDCLDSDAVLAIEWSENIEFALPEKHWSVSFSYGENENERIIIIKMNNE